MDDQELLKERFKSAVSSTVKAISENFDLEIKFGRNLSSKKNSLNLPEIEVCKFCQCKKCNAIVPQACEAIM